MLIGYRTALVGLLFVLSACEGPKGEPGPIGAPGHDGSDGANGKDGTNGSDGAVGTDGTNGRDGANGMDGTNGSNGKDAADSWSRQGNAGTDPSSDYLGTRDKTDLVIRTNATQAMRISTIGNVGIGDGFGLGISEPGAGLHVSGKDVLLQAFMTAEKKSGTGINFQLVGDVGTGNAMRSNPKFSLGQIEGGGDGSPNFRLLYSDQVESMERPVLELDSKGIVASVKPDRGSHFEGFIGEDCDPTFRINSFKDTQLELGPGRGKNECEAGKTYTDVLLRRDAAQDGATVGLTVSVGRGDTNEPVDRVRVDASASVAPHDTWLLVRVNGDQVSKFERVSVGSADSCGTGFRCLRVPNDQ